MSAVIIRTMPGGPRNGLPGTGAERVNYVYRGTDRDELTAHLDNLRDRPPCGKRMTWGRACGRRKGHDGDCRSEEAIAAERARGARYRQARRTS